MSGTLNANYVQSDVGTNLYLNTGLSSGSVTIGNTSPLIANTISANTVGIGTTSPTNPLDVVGNVRSILQTSGDFTGVSLGNNGTTNPRIQFSTSDGSPRYFIQGNGNSSLDFVTVLAGTNYTAMSLGRTTNNLVFGQNGSGIQFTNSSALTNSVLNDYEQGTFTPTLTFGGNSVGITYSNRQGSYTKIGNMVYFNIWINLSSKGSSTGSLWVSGMPFAMNQTLNGSTYPVTASLYAATSGPTSVFGGVYLSNCYMYYQYASGYSNLQDSVVTNTSQIQFGGCYQATF
jgi:hypothetical protein